MAKATAPASSANLGAGFDTLALALELRCEVQAVPADEWEVTHGGPEIPPREAEDRVLEAARRAVPRTEALALTVRNQIPVGMGLGASAAAAVAGYASAKRALAESASADDAFRAASDLDGHADNAAAAAFGGLIAVTLEGSAVPLQLHPELKVVLAIPEDPLPTATSRRVLSAQIDRGVAVRSIARVVSLTEGLRTADPDLLTNAMGDELHEAPRASLRPEIADVIRSAMEAGAVFACWSGAGPSVLAVTAGVAGQRTVASALSSDLGDETRVITPDIAELGLT